jgi:DNA-binding NarL/FixJ family response regulator
VIFSRVIFSRDALEGQDNRMRLFIADGNSSVRLALQMYLQQEPGMYVTGMAAEAEGLPAQLEASRPDVMLLDWFLPGASMQDLLSDIGELEAPPKIVVLSIKPEVKGRALSAGADAFIRKDAPPEELFELVNTLGQTANSTE